MFRSSVADEWACTAEQSCLAGWTGLFNFEQQWCETATHKNIRHNLFIGLFIIIGNSVILRGESDRRWVYISSPNEQELQAVVNTLTHDDRCFAVIEDWMLPLLDDNSS